MKIYQMFIVLAIVCILIFAGFSIYRDNLGKGEEKQNEPPYGEPHLVDGKDVHIAHRMGENLFETYVDGNWTEVLLKGVNMGLGKPGHFPGESSITENEYRRWFDQIGEMNANAVRIYTYHPPGFYKALKEYNEKHEDDPIYLFHGVWLTEEKLLETQDIWDPSIDEEYRVSIKRTIDLINGNITLEPEPGHASGKYTADVSRYVMGIIIGLEWYPSLVQNSINQNFAMPQYDGGFFRTQDASPFEIWLAYAMDMAIEYETFAYGEQRPISFVNWPTTDSLTHMDEHGYYEDLVEIDPDNIRSVERFLCGQFATYHIYPYYPDFMNYQETYVNSVGWDGKPSNYAGYLRDLSRDIDLPILVGEFGVPASRGMAHESVYGMDHGHLTEEEQGVMVSAMFREIAHQNYAGGCMFSWHDEWFKRTWNTAPSVNMSRIPFWNDAQTCEQHYGVLGFFPGDEQSIRIDGETDDWKVIRHSRRATDHDGIFGEFEDGYDLGRRIDGIHLFNDPGYLYIRVDYGHLGDSIDWNMMNTLILLDTIPDQGNTEIPFNTGLKPISGVDFIIQLAGENDSRVLVDSYYDVNHYRFAHLEEQIPEEEYASKKDNGEFHDIEMALTREFRLKTQGTTVPFTTHKTGYLEWGNTDPESEEYDSLADFMGSSENNCIEMRIPWGLLNFRDPSRKEVMGDIWEEGLESSKFIESLNIAVVTFKPDEDGNAMEVSGLTNITDSLLHTTGATIHDDSLYQYNYNEWDLPDYHERLKESYYIIQETYSEY